MQRYLLHSSRIVSKQVSRLYVKSITYINLFTRLWTIIRPIDWLIDQMNERLNRLSWLIELEKEKERSQIKHLTPFPLLFLNSFPSVSYDSPHMIQSYISHLFIARTQTSRQLYRYKYLRPTTTYFPFLFSFFLTNPLTNKSPFHPHKTLDPYRHPTMLNAQCPI